MAYIDIYTAATDVDSLLRKQTAVALAKTATDIANEATNTADHGQRLAWARRVLADPVGWSAKAIWKVLENPTIQAAPASASDGDVLFVVISAIPYLMKAV
jgi:hypothetical protein